MKMKLSVLLLSSFSVFPLLAQKGRHIVFENGMRDHVATCLGHRLEGKVKSITQSSGTSWSVRYDFDEKGRLVSISDLDAKKVRKYSKFKYDKSGNVVKKEYMDNGYKSVVTATFDQYGNLLTRETKEDGEKEIVTFTYDFGKREIIAKKADEDYPKRIYLFDENGYVYSSQYYPFKNVKNTNIYSYDQQQQLCKEINIKENDNVYGITIDSIEVSYSFTLDGFWKQKDIRESSKRLDKDKEGNFKEPVFDMAESSIVYFDVKKDSLGNIIGYAEKSANDKIRVVTRSIIYYE